MLVGGIGMKVGCNRWNVLGILMLIDNYIYGFLGVFSLSNVDIIKFIPMILHYSEKEKQLPKYNKTYHIN
jgi:hypothetical protein